MPVDPVVADAVAICLVGVCCMCCPGLAALCYHIKMFSAECSVVISSLWCSSLLDSDAL